VASFSEHVEYDTAFGVDLDTDPLF
jgi:hypothetical protein